MLTTISNMCFRIFFATTLVLSSQVAAQPHPRNLLPATPDGWTAWSPRPELSPQLDVNAASQGLTLRLASSRFEQYGKWVAVAPVTAGKHYRFEAEFQQRNVKSTEVSVGAILTWRDASGRALQRDYVDNAPNTAGGWASASRALKAPERAETVAAELMLRWTAGGSVTWRHPRLFETAAPLPRKVRIATTRISPGPKPTVEANVQLMLETLDRAAASKPDLVLFTENLVDRGVRRPLLETAQPVPGPATNALADRARRFKLWVAASLHEIENGLIYNTAVLIDREGRIAGKYRKVHLANTEAEAGITPGSEYPVFDTDFGRVGIEICWDNWFGEAVRELRLRGAEIILLPIAGDGVPGHWDLVSRARAIDNGVFLVASSTAQRSPSRIVSPDGIVLAEAADGIAVADLDLSAETRVQGLSFAALGEGKSLYLKERRPDTYGQASQE
jgi:predicted amidohydrolase